MNSRQLFPEYFLWVTHSTCSKQFTYFMLCSRLPYGLGSTLPSSTSDLGVGALTDAHSKG